MSQLSNFNYAIIDWERKIYNFRIKHTMHHSTVHQCSVVVLELEDGDERLEDLQLHALVRLGAREPEADGVHLKRRRGR